MGNKFVIEAMPQGEYAHVTLVGVKVNSHIEWMAKAANGYVWKVSPNRSSRVDFTSEWTTNDAYRRAFGKLVGIPPKEIKAARAACVEKRRQESRRIALKRMRDWAAQNGYKFVKIKDAK